MLNVSILFSEICSYYNHYNKNYNLFVNGTERKDHRKLAVVWKKDIEK